MYNSTPTVKIYQDDPLDWKQSPHKLKSWTETVVGYQNEAQKLSRCILENRKLMGRDYPWDVSINIEVELLPSEIKTLWSKVCRKMRQQGIEALWVREPSKSNHCNYHLIVKNEMPKTKLAAIIETAMPSRDEFPWHKHIDRIRSQFHYPRYITKARTKGVVNGKVVWDKYRDKRLLFKPKLGLQKAGTIGKFWEMPKEAIWQAVKDKEQRIADGLDMPNIRRYAKHVHDLLGGTVPIKKIQRSYGNAAHHLRFQETVTAFYED